MPLMPMVALSALLQPGIYAAGPESNAVEALTPPPIVALEDKPPVYDQWTGNVAIGATWSDGNTKRQSANAGADAEYRRERSRWTLNALWNYTDEDGDVTQRRIYGAAKYDWFLSEKTYALAQTSGEYDAQADVDLRSTLGVGVGRQFKDTEELKLLGEAGVTYFNEDYVGSADDQDYVAARLAYKVDWVPKKDWTLSQSAQLFPSLEDKDDVYAQVDTKARVNLTEKMFAQLQWIYSWDNTPATGKDRVDNLVLLALGWAF